MWFKKQLKKSLSLLGIEKRHAAFPIFRYNRYSQNGEDGVIEFILKKIPSIPRYLIDIGANDGVESSNSRLLIEKYGFEGLLIEPFAPAFAKLQALYKDHANMKLLNMAVGGKTEKKGYINWHGHFQNISAPLTNVNEAFHQAQTPHDIGLLSIDIDGHDNEVLQSINWQQCSPVIVIAEIDSSSQENLQKQFDIMDQAGYTPILHIGNVFYVKKQMAGLYFFNWRLHLPGEYGFFQI